MSRLLIASAITLGLLSPLEAKKGEKKNDNRVERHVQKHGRQPADEEWRRRTTDEGWRYRTERSYRDNWEGQTGERFKGMDRNGDGHITRSEWRGNDKSFSRQDRNGNGVIDPDDK